MPATKKKPVTKTKKQSATENGIVVGLPAEVFTLAEAAAFLRVSEAELAKLAEARDIPARRIGTDWRFLKIAVERWLGAARPAMSKDEFWNIHFGAMKGDPYLEELLRKNNALHDRSAAEAG